MAKRKYKKRKTTKTAKKRASNIDLTIVALIIFSILLAVLIYGKSGVIGVKLNEILGGMMGIIKYVLPIGIFAVAIKIACADNEYISSKLMQYAILLIGFSVLMSVYQIDTGELTVLDKELSAVVKDAYDLRSKRKWRRSARSNSCYTTCKSFRKDRCYNTMYWCCFNVCSVYIWYKYVRNYKQYSREVRRK